MKYLVVGIMLLCVPLTTAAEDLLRSDQVMPAGKPLFNNIPTNAVAPDDDGDACRTLLEAYPAQHHRFQPGVAPDGANTGTSVPAADLHTLDLLGSSTVLDIQPRVWQQYEEIVITSNEETLTQSLYDTQVHLSAPITIVLDHQRGNVTLNAQPVDNFSLRQHQESCVRALR